MFMFDISKFNLKMFNMFVILTFWAFRQFGRFEILELSIYLLRQRQVDMTSMLRNPLRIVSQFPEQTLITA